MIRYYETLRVYKGYYLSLHETEEPIVTAAQPTHIFAPPYYYWYYMSYPSYFMLNATTIHCSSRIAGIIFNTHGV